jgi:hypothetical protein
MYRLNFLLLVLLAISFTACSKSNKRLFTLSCPTPTTCTKTANVYVVNVDGLYIELRPEFVEECLKQSATNSMTNIYCKQMSAPGDTETLSASADVIKHLQEDGFNPTDADVERRMQIAESKIYGQ